MAIIRYDHPFFQSPWSDFERTRRDLNALMQALSRGGEHGASGSGVYPALNIFEDEEAIHVRAEIPGVAPADINISVEGETLTIKGERAAREAGEKRSYHRREMEHGNFSRAVTLPVRVVASEVSAQSRDGILTITLPKAEEAKPKKIKVQDG